MAVVIPKSPLSDVSLATDRGGAIRSGADQTLARALQGFGGAMTNAGDAFTQERDKQQLFDDNAKYLLHREQTQTALAEAQRGMPAEATGFTPSFFSTRTQPDQQFLGSVSEKNRDHFAKRWQVDQENFKQQASAAEYAARAKYEENSLNSVTDIELRKLAADPSYKPKAVETIGAFLGNTTAIPAEKQIEIKKNVAAMLDKVEAEQTYRGDPEGLAKALGINMSKPVPGAGGRMQAGDVRNIFLDEVKRQGLVGTVPPDGAKYGIKTGSAEEWAAYFTALSYHESGHDNRNVGDVGQFVGGSRGLLQLSYNDAQNYGFNNGKPFTAEQLADPKFNAAVGVAITKQLVGQHGSIEGGAGKYWGPISKEGWTPGKGRDANMGAAAGGDGSVPGDPRFSAIPYATRMQMVEKAYADRKAAVGEANAARNTFQNGNKERFQLGIEAGDTNVTQSSILDANQKGMVDDGQAAELLAKLRTREKDTGVGESILAALASGQKATLDPYDEGAKKGAEYAYEKMVKADPTSALRSVDAIQQATGIVPPKAASALRASMVGTDPNAAQSGMQVANNLLMRNPNVFAGAPGGDEIARKATLFRHSVEDLGYTGADAVKRVMAMDDPAARSKIKVTDDEAKAFTDSVKKTSLIGSSAGSLFDNSGWLGNPRIGQTEPIRAAMLNDFAELATDFYRKGYDAEAAKAMAKQQLSSFWGVTNIQGTAWNGTVMKYAPELRYPAAYDSKGAQGYGYITEQAAEFAKAESGRDIKPENIILAPIPTTTAAAWGGGRLLPYQVIYTYQSADGHTMFGAVDGKSFVADPTRGAKAIDAANMAANAESVKIATPETPSTAAQQRMRDAQDAEWQQLDAARAARDKARKPR